MSSLLGEDGDSHHDAHRFEEFTSLKKSLSRISNAGRPDPVSYVQNEDFRKHKSSSSSGSLHIDIPQLPMAAEIALTALQYLPTPLLVLSSLKTILLANESMGRLLGLRNIVGETGGANDTVTDILKGQTLSQIGIDMISDGVPVWVSWEKFLDNLASDINPDGDELSRITSGEITPVASKLTSDETTFGKPYEAPARGRTPIRDTTLVHDTVVDVIVSSAPLQHHHKPKPASQQTLKSPGIQSTCRMIISIWTQDNQRFFTLTFTSPAAHNHFSHGSHSHVVPRAKSNGSTRSSRSSHSHTPTSSTSSSVVHSPSESTPTSSISAFPPHRRSSKVSASCNLHRIPEDY